MPMVGSSPLARGLLVMHRWGNYAKRIIPARAGFTPACTAVQSLVTDHPRSRGVYRAHTGILPALYGSSPLARGLHLHGDIALRLHRIIPARAGFTGARVRGAPEAWDHPRSRGVYTSPLLALCREGGSSPLARGLRRRCVRCLRNWGIIPARAGFTGRDQGQRQ